MTNFSEVAKNDALNGKKFIVYSSPIVKLGTQDVGPAIAALRGEELKNW